MTKLLQRGLDPFAMSDRSTVGVPEGLPFEELTPGGIAKFWNNQEAYERALQNAGRLNTDLDDLDRFPIKDHG